MNIRITNICFYLVKYDSINMNIDNMMIIILFINNNDYYNYNYNNFSNSLL